MVKKRGKNRIPKERLYKRSAMLLLAVFVLTPLVCKAHTAQDPDKSRLMAGQYTHVGEVWIWNNDENLYVKYQTSEPWYTTETHLYVGTTLPSSPISPGGFPYQHENLDNVHQDLYTVSLAELGVGSGVSVYVLAQAVVRKIGADNEETAWKEGIPIEQEDGGWARYNTYQIQKVPWIEVSISETELIWDIFKPGRYTSLGPVFRIASNAGVVISYGTGGPDSALGPAVRKDSLLPKRPSNSRTLDDEIRLWATCLWGRPSSPQVGDPELVPPEYRISTHPGDLFSYWIDFIHLDGYQMKIPESKRLRKGIPFSWYTMISVDPSCSEGNYFEQFVITISAQP